MADRTITIDILANDYATAVFRNVGHGVSSFASTAYSGIESANKALRRYNSSMQGFNSVVTSVFRTAGRAIYDFTVDSIKQFAELERQHAKTMGVLSSTYDFNWNGNNTAEQLKNMEQFYKDSAALKEQAYTMGSVGPTGRGSLYSPDEISAAQLSLARAGITSDQMLNTDIVETVIKFAGGNDISVDSAVAFGVQLGAQFDKGPDEWAQMFDQVTNAANMAPIDVNDVMSSLKYVGNMAAGYDVPLSDVLSAIVIMGQSGLKGSQAGSGISAIFSRGMNPTGVTTASRAPTENVENIYNSFKDKVIDSNGNFIGLEGFTEELQVVMDDLTDVELAWFNKKMFGMYQQKAALALGRTAEDGDKTFGDIANAIAENSEGINDALYDLILESSGGQIEALSNVWQTTKMRFGDAISPVTKEVTKQLINGLTTNNMSIDAESLQLALDEAVANVNDQFGEQIAGWVQSIGQLGIDGSQIAGAVLPDLAGGTLDFLTKFASGDILGAFESFQNAIELTDEKIAELPPELQDTATKFRNLIVWIERLYAFNIVAKISEMITSLAILVGGIGGFIYKLFKGNISASLNSTVTSANTVVNGANITVNASYAGINAGQIGNATFGMIQNVASFMATTTNMTVTATSVIVNGGSVTGGGTGGGSGPTLVDAAGNPLTSFGNGMAQGAGFSLGAGATAVGGGLLLNGAMNAGLLGGGSAAPLMLGGGSSAVAALPAASAAAEGGGAAAATAGSAIGGTLLKTLGTVGMVVTVASLLTTHAGFVGDVKEFEDFYNDAVSNGILNKDEIYAYAGMFSDEMYQAMRSAWDQYTGDMEYVDFMNDWLNKNYGTNRKEWDGDGYQPVEFIEGVKLGDDFVYFDEWIDSYQRMLSFANSAEGLQTFYDAINKQLQNGGKINEDFLKNFFEANDLEMRGGYGQALVEMMMSNMFNTTDQYERPGNFFGDFADDSINKFIKQHINDTIDWSQFGTVAQVLAALNGALDNMEYVPNTDSVYRNVTTGEQYQLTDDGRLVAWNEAAAQMSNAATDLTTAASDMSISARDMAAQMIASGAINVLDLGQGPLSTDGAIDYLTNQMTGNTGKNDWLNIPNPFSIMSGENIINRFNSSMTGNTESGSGIAQTNETLNDIDAQLDQIVTEMADNITDEQLRAAFLEGFNNYEAALNGEITGLQTSVISLHDAVTMLSQSPSWVNSLGQGPLSSDGAYSYVMEQLASGTAANQQLLQNIQNGVSALDPTLTVDITNRAPIVNTTVNVKVDQAGNVTKQVLNGFSAIDNWLYRSSQRFGTTTRIER